MRKTAGCLQSILRIYAKEEKIYIIFIIGSSPVAGLIQTPDQILCLSLLINDHDTTAVNPDRHTFFIKPPVMKIMYIFSSFAYIRKMLCKHPAVFLIYYLHNLHYRWLDKEGMPVWINCRGIVISDQQGKAEYLVGCLNETGNKRRADNVTGLLGGPEFLAYLRAQKEPITKGFFMHVGIDDFGAINSSRGADYGNYILKSVAGCMKECLSDKQRIYHNQLPWSY